MFRRCLLPVFFAVMVVPHSFLLLLSLGSGWSFPALLPDRLDAAPWRDLLALSGLWQAAVCGLQLSFLCGLLSAASGLLLSRTIRRLPLWLRRSGRAAILFPFVISPAVAAVCLFDLAARTGAVGTFTGVLLCQLVFGTAAAAVILQEGWSDAAERQEQLVRMLGGGTGDVWTHVVWPHSRGLLGICFLQTALFSWLDYGIVLHLGGGRVTTLTVRLFTLIREASMNHAALAALLLLMPAVLFVLLLMGRGSGEMVRARVVVEQRR